MKDIESALQATFDDRKLSQNEKYALISLLKDYQDDVDSLNYARNCAFKIFRQYQATQSNFEQDAFKWLEHAVKSIDRVRAEQLPLEKDSAYFSPGDECKRRIISAVKHAKKSVDVCVFTISDDQISQALLDAHRRGINVRVITDNDKANDLGSDVDMLSSKGVDVDLKVKLLVLQLQGIAHGLIVISEIPWGSHQSLLSSCLQAYERSLISSDSLPS